MSKEILDKLDGLTEELNSLERRMIDKRQNSSSQSMLFNSENENLKQELKIAQDKNRKVKDIIDHSIMKLEQAIEKEEKSNA